MNTNATQIKSPMKKETQRQEINLFTLDFRRDDQPYSFAFVSRCCLIFFIALMLVEGYTAWRLFAEQEQLAQVKITQQQIKTRLTALKQSQPLSQRPKLEKTLTQLQAQIQRREELQKIMGGQEFGNFDGFSTHLVGLARQANKDVSLTHIHLLSGGNTLQLEGWARRAESVPKYLQDLRNENSLQDVRFGVLEIEKDPQQSHKLHFVLGERKDDRT